MSEIEELGIDSDEDNPVVVTGMKRKRKAGWLDLTNELFLATWKNSKLQIVCTIVAVKANFNIMLVSSCS